MVAGVFGITQILRVRADWLGLLGGAAMLIGQIAGVRIGVILQLMALSESGVTGIPPNLIELLLKSAPSGNQNHKNQAVRPITVLM
jgi:hypothetical protein